MRLKRSWARKPHLPGLEIQRHAVEFAQGEGRPVVLIERT
jgi:hypothetical protein